MSLDTLETFSPVLRELVEHGIRRRLISYEELNTCLPDEFVDPEKIDELLVFLGEHSIEMVDEVEIRRNSYICFEAPLQTNLKFQRDDPKRASRPDSLLGGPAQPSAAALAAAELEIKKKKRKIEYIQVPKHWFSDPLNHTMKVVVRRCLIVCFSKMVVRSMDQRNCP